MLRFGRKQLIACKHTKVPNTISLGIPKSFIGLQERVRGCGVVVGEGGGGASGVGVLLS